MNEWIDELSDLTAGGERVVVVTVAGIRGSAPREVGAKMIVTDNETIGTIGGACKSGNGRSVVAIASRIAWNTERPSIV